MSAFAISLNDPFGAALPFYAQADPAREADLRVEQEGDGPEVTAAEEPN